MALDRKARRIALLVGIVLIAGAVALLLDDQRGLQQGSPQGPSGTRVEQRMPQNSATRDAANLEDLRRAVEELHETLSGAPLDGTAWQEAEREAEEIVQRWVSFKTPMRAGAGDLMWRTEDVNAFDTAIKETRTYIQDRNLEGARKGVDTMRDLIEKYDDTRRGRLETGPDD